VVDAVVLAHGKLTWEDEFSDTRFARLHDVAVSDMPSVAVRLAFAMLDKRPVIHGELRAEVVLVCQRCLHAMQYPVREQFELMLIESDAELERVPEAYEPWIANAVRLNVLDLVEEQLLLALPLIAKHADEGACVSVAAPASVPPKASQQTEMLSDGEVQRPFGNLRDLLRK
jgi:uncharacterized protein